MVATSNARSEAFTKAREPERIKSVSDEIDPEDEIQPSTSINKGNNWDMVGNKTFRILLLSTEIFTLLSSAC